MGRSKYTTIPKVQGEEVIVSLTTFPARINKVYITIETIFQQETLPNRIILWLANKQFPRGLYALPQRLLNMQQKGLEIRFCEDIRSYKKYYYSIKNNPVDVIGTQRFNLSRGGDLGYSVTQGVTNDD